MTEKDKEINELRRENERLKKEVQEAYRRGMYEAYYQASEHMKELLHKAWATSAGLDIPEASDEDID